VGLDQFAYSAAKANEDYSKQCQIAYWRKHPNLHGWMEKLWLQKQMVPVDQGDRFIVNSYPSSIFNGIELEITWEDLDQLEQAILNKTLPPTQGSFFGNNADDHYQQHDLAFVKNARADLFSGLKVFYNSSW